MPELKRNILNFGYRINFKYKGMLSHLFDRFYVFTKFILPTIDDLKYSPDDFDSECSYLMLCNIFLISRSCVQNLYFLLISIRNRLITIKKQFIIF